MSARNEILFVDMAYVDKGYLAPSYDADRLSAEGRAAIEELRREWNILTDLSGHGMKRVKMPFGVRVTPELPNKSAPWLEADRPWEVGLAGYHTVIHDRDRYRCWYLVRITPEARDQMFPAGVKASPPDHVLGYAESADGTRWYKPELDIYRYNGQPTNIVSPYGLESGVFLDPSAPPEERYKCFDLDQLPLDPALPITQRTGLYPCVSPDGYHWTRAPEAALRYFHDSENIAAWDPLLGKYVGYFRGHLHGRAIARSETDDFRHWPPAQVFWYPGAEDEVSEDYYTNGFTVYPGDPSLRLLFPAIYRHTSDDLYIRMAVSRDNRAWNWVSRRPILAPGRVGEWDCGSVYVGPNLVRLPDGRLAVPYAGHVETHNESFAQYYKDYTSAHFKLAWAMWGDGRLAGLEAEDYGEFWCPMTLHGPRLEINARTGRAGFVEVAVYEAAGRRGVSPLQGLGFEDGARFAGDAIWAPLEWKDPSRLAACVGRPLFLHVRLSGAKLFGFASPTG